MQPELNIRNSEVVAHPSMRSSIVMVALLYILVLVIAELVSLTLGPVAGLVCHCAAIWVLVRYAGRDNTTLGKSVYLAMAQVSLLRILSVSMPVHYVPPIYWYAMIGVPALVGIGLVMRSQGRSLPAIGLGRAPWFAEAMIALTGIPLGIAAFLLFRPQPLVVDAPLGTLLISGVMLAVFGAALEEVLFRGLLQSVLVDATGDVGVLLGSAMFATMYIGSLSTDYIVFTWAVGLLFGWFARRTGAIVGVVAAHVLLTVGMLLVWPLLLPGLLPH